MKNEKKRKKKKEERKLLLVPSALFAMEIISGGESLAFKNFWKLDQYISLVCLSVRTRSRHSRYT